MVAAVNKQPEQFKVHCEEILREDAKAVLVKVDAKHYGLVCGELCEMWFPRSQVHSVYNVAPPHLMITPWIAMKKGLK